MVILNHNDTGETGFTKAIRLNIIMKYFAAVYFGGDKAFNEGKT